MSMQTLWEEGMKTYLERAENFEGLKSYLMEIAPQKTAVDYYTSEKMVERIKEALEAAGLKVSELKITDLKPEKVDNIYLESMFVLRYAPLMSDEEAKELGYESVKGFIESYAKFYLELMENYSTIAHGAVIRRELVEEIAENAEKYLEMFEGLRKYREKLRES